MKPPLLAAALIVAAQAHAADYLPTCPESIDVQQAIKKTPYGWSAGIYGGGMDNVKYGLSNIQFSSGDPSEYAWLVPDTDKKHSATWQFVPKSKEGYWITCEYQLTSVTLTQRLPDDVKSCTVEYDARFSNPVPKSVRCKR